MLLLTVPCVNPSVRLWFRKDVTQLERSPQRRDTKLPVAATRLDGKDDVDFPGVTRGDGAVEQHLGAFRGNE